MPQFPSFKLTASSLILPFLLSSLVFAEEAAVPEKTVQTEVTSEFIFKYLAGEFAGQRGDLAIAGRMFLELAQSTNDPRLAERATKAAVYGKDFITAIQAADLWTELDPASVEAQQATTQMLISIGRLDEAKQHLQKLLEKESTRANGFLYLNSLLARHADKNAALNLVQALAQPYPELAEAHFSVAYAAWTAKQNDLAITELDAADQLRADWEMSALLRGQILYAQSPDATLAFFRKFLEQTPKANEVRANYARLLIGQKRLDEARTECAKLVQNANGNPETLMLAGLMAIQAEGYQDAEKYLNQALKTDYKDKNQLYLYLGQLADKQKHEKEAQEWFNKVQPGERYLDAKIGIANIMARNKQTDSAIKMLNDLEELSTEQQILVTQVQANLLTQDKRDKEAFDLLGETVKNQPNSPELVYDYAMAAERVKELDVAEKELRKLILLKPDFAQAYNALGYSLADRNQKLDEAKSLIEKALELSPDDHFILDSMGWVQYRLGNLEQAVEYLQKAFKAQPDPEIAAHLGEVLWQQGKHDEAKKTWSNALQEHPDNEVLLATTRKFKP